jgi:hypothetical protein
MYRKIIFSVCAWRQRESANMRGRERAWHKNPLFTKGVDCWNNHQSNNQGCFLDQDHFDSIIIYILCQEEDGFEAEKILEKRIVKREKSIIFCEEVKTFDGILETTLDYEVNNRRRKMC